MTTPNEPRPNEAAERLLRRLVTVIDAAHVWWNEPVPADAMAAIHDAKEYVVSRAAESERAALVWESGIDSLAEAMAAHSGGIGFGHSTDSCDVGCAAAVLARLAAQSEEPTDG